MKKQINNLFKERLIKIMEKTKITNKSRYAAIINVLTGMPSDIETDELVNFCERQIDAIDRKSEKARARAAEQRKVSDELTERIAAMLTDEPQTLGELAAAIGDEDITTSKVSARCFKLVKEGRAAKTEVTVPGADGAKSRKLVAYTCA